MESILKELWHGNIVPQEDSRTNSKEMKELLGYMARHHEDLEKSFRRNNFLHSWKGENKVIKNNRVFWARLSFYGEYIEYLKYFDM